MAALFLGLTLIVMALFIKTALNRIESLEQQIEALEVDNGWGNW